MAYSVILFNLYLLSLERGLRAPHYLRNVQVKAKLQTPVGLTLRWHTCYFCTCVSREPHVTLRRIRHFNRRTSEEN